MMPRFRRHVRFSLIAFAAIAGMLSFGGEASASTSTAAVSRAKAQASRRSCCVKQRVCAACCCVPAGASARRGEPRALPAIAPSTGARLASSTGVPCECRSNDPAAPARLPDESRGVDPRGGLGQGWGAAAEPVLGLASVRSSARRAGPAAPPSATPLYIRTARLLI